MDLSGLFGFTGDVVSVSLWQGASWGGYTQAYWTECCDASFLTWKSHELLHRILNQMVFYL